MSAVCDAVVKLIVDRNYRDNRGAGERGATLWVKYRSGKVSPLPFPQSWNLRMVSSFKSLTTILCGLPVTGCGGGDGV